MEHNALRTGLIILFALRSVLCALRTPPHKNFLLFILYSRTFIKAIPLINNNEPAVKKNINASLPVSNFVVTNMMTTAITPEIPINILTIGLFSR